MNLAPPRERRQRQGIQSRNPPSASVRAHRPRWFGRTRPLPGAIPG